MRGRKGWVGEAFIVRAFSSLYLHSRASSSFLSSQVEGYLCRMTEHITKHSCKAPYITGLFYPSKHGLRSLLPWYE